jgi:hypothetical protein
VVAPTAAARQARSACGWLSWPGWSFGWYVDATTLGDITITGQPDGYSGSDVAFVQGGLTDGVDISDLVSLGTVFVQPLMVY